jgi:hypothetical protein
VDKCSDQKPGSQPCKKQGGIRETPRFIRSICKRELPSYNDHRKNADGMEYPSAKNDIRDKLNVPGTQSKNSAPYTKRYDGEGWGLEPGMDPVKIL